MFLKLDLTPIFAGDFMSLIASGVLEKASLVTRSRKKELLQD
jgi:hypothetical protein